MINILEIPIDVMNEVLLILCLTWIMFINHKIIKMG